MSFWDSFSSAADTLADKVGAVAETAADIYKSVTSVKTAKAQQDTANQVAKIQANATLEAAKNGMWAPTTAAASTSTEALAPAPTSGQSTPIVINKQAENGNGMMLLLLAGLLLVGAK